MEQRTLFLNGSAPKNLSLEPSFWEVPWYVADGGWRHVQNLCRRNPHLRPPCATWVGDGDSLGTPRPVAPGKRPWSALTSLFLSPEKDVSDFGSILDLLERAIGANPKAYSQGIFLEIVGGLGGRRDHECINIEEARFWLKKLPCLGVCHFQPGVWVARGPFEVFVNKDQEFSIFGVDNCHVQGAKYQGLLTLTRPSHGLGNVGLGQKVLVTPPQNGCVTLVVP